MMAINITAIMITSTTTTTTTTTTRRHLHAVLLITLYAMRPLEPPVTLHHALLRQASQQLQAVYILRVAAGNVTHATQAAATLVQAGHAHAQQLALVTQHAQEGVCGRGLVSAGQQVTDEHVEGNWVVAEEVDAEDCLG